MAMIATSPLGYREARQRYAPRVIACRTCDALIPPTCTLERVEALCSSCLYACGLGSKADAARRRFLRIMLQRSLTMKEQESSSF